MVSLENITLPAAALGRLRLIKPQQDLPQIADLVELCFREALDSEGRSYIRHLRSAAKTNPMLQLASSAAEFMNGLPVSGLVWEESGHIVGNVSLIPLDGWRKQRYLIANVAVHPEWRGRGIGRMMTSAAMSFMRRRRVKTVWLQVREDNPSAVRIYSSLAFKEIARRTDWLCKSKPSWQELPAGMVLGKRNSRYWMLQRTWLEQLYPNNLRWHLPIRERLLQPGFWGALERTFSLENPRQWAILWSGKLHGVLTSVNLGGPTNHLWLSTPSEGEFEPGSIQALLVGALSQSSFYRPYSLNLPAGYALDEIIAAGFIQERTLIWMQSQL